MRGSDEGLIARIIRASLAKAIAHVKRAGRNVPRRLLHHKPEAGSDELKTTIEARSSRAGVGHFSYANGPHHHIFEIWRVGNLREPL